MEWSRGDGRAEQIVTMKTLNQWKGWRTTQKTVQRGCGRALACLLQGHTEMCEEDPRGIGVF